MIRAALILALLTLPALARNTGQWAANSPLADWWASLSNANGGNCCSYADGREVHYPDWRITNDPEFPYDAFVDGEWRKVPKASVVKAPNKVGYAVVWPAFDEETGGIYIRCFMPGAET